MVTRQHGRSRCPWRYTGHAWTSESECTGKIEEVHHSMDAPIRISSSSARSRRAVLFVGVVALLGCRGADSFRFEFPRLWYRGECPGSTIHHDRCRKYQCMYAAVQVLRSISSRVVCLRTLVHIYNCCDRCGLLHMWRSDISGEYLVESRLPTSYGPRNCLQAWNTHVRSAGGMDLRRNDQRQQDPYP